MSTEVSFAIKLAHSSMLWPALLVCALLLGLLLWFRRLATTLTTELQAENLSEATRFDLEEARSTAIATRQACKFFFLALLLGYLTYVAVEGTPMYGYVM